MTVVDHSQGQRQYHGLTQRLEDCRRILRQWKKVAVAFSGGVDSTLLLALAVEELGAPNVLAVTSVSPVQPRRDEELAREICRQLGVEWRRLDTDELNDPSFVANDPKRCYRCKHLLFGQFQDVARRRGLDAVLSGVNWDDQGDYRPGMQAQTELGVRSPLLEAELTKDDIRALARERNLPNWDRPSAACLASRVPYGEPITPEKLRQIDRAEDFLHSLGFAQCRVRCHGPLARLEFPARDIAAATAMRSRISDALKELGFLYVTIDLDGYRTGSMNEALPSDR